MSNQDHVLEAYGRDRTLTVFLTIVIQSQLMYLSKICTSANYFFEIILILKLVCEPLVFYGWGLHNPRTDRSYYDIKVSS